MIREKVLNQLMLAKRMSPFGVALCERKEVEAFKKGFIRVKSFMSDDQSELKGALRAVLPSLK